MLGGRSPPRAPACSGGSKPNPKGPPKPGRTAASMAPTSTVAAQETARNLARYRCENPPIRRTTHCAMGSMWHSPAAEAATHHSSRNRFTCAHDGPHAPTHTQLPGAWQGCTLANSQIEASSAKRGRATRSSARPVKGAAPPTHGRPSSQSRSAKQRRLGSSGAGSNCRQAKLPISAATADRGQKEGRLRHKEQVYGNEKALHGMTRR